MNRQKNVAVYPHNPIQNCKNSMSGKVIMIVKIKEWSFPNENKQETGVILLFMINSPSEMKSLVTSFHQMADLPSLTE